MAPGSSGTEEVVRVEARDGGASGITGEMAAGPSPHARRLARDSTRDGSPTGRSRLRAGARDHEGGPLGRLCTTRSCQCAVSRASHGASRVERLRRSPSANHLADLAVRWSPRLEPRRRQLDAPREAARRGSDRMRLSRQGQPDPARSPKQRRARIASGRHPVGCGVRSVRPPVRPAQLKGGPYPSS